MSTPKKKPAARKAKPAKKPAARQIPPPPPGWEIVGKDDPRLDCLPCRPMAYHSNRGEWAESIYRKGEKSACLAGLTYALPIATQSATLQPQSPTPMIRLRLPSEKPTKEDADKNGYVHVIYEERGGMRSSCSWYWTREFEGDELAWFSLPDGILPREPSQEEKWRAEGEKLWPAVSGKMTASNSHEAKEAFLRGFLAAKKGGAK